MRKPAQRGAQDLRNAATRAADTDRIQVAQLLTDAAAQGQLQMSDYEDRLTKAYAAQTYEELDRLRADLLGSSMSPQRGGATKPAPSMLLLAIMSAFERRGRWNVPKKLTTFALWGGGVIDLRYADFTSTHHAVPLDLDIDFGRQQDGLPTHDRGGVDLDFGGGEVGVAEVDHAASPQCERRQLLRHVPAAAPLERAHDGQQQHRRRGLDGATALGTHRRPEQVGPQTIQFFVRLRRVGLGEAVFVIAHLQLALSCGVGEQLRYLNAIGVGGTRRRVP